MSLWSRLANLGRQDRLNRELDEEMESHIAEAIEHGRDPEEARRAFGPPLRWREDSRDIKLVPWLESIGADAVFGWRQLRKNGPATGAAVLSLALAMGACLCAFRLVDGLLLRPLPVASPDRLFVLTFPYTDEAGHVQVADSFDYPQFRALRAAVAGQAELLAITGPNRNGLTFGSDEEIERFSRQSVSGSTFAALGLKPALGRLLTAADDATPGGHPVAVLSYDYWRRRFGTDPGVIGRRFRMGKDLYEVVGVTEEAFTGTEPGIVTDVFLPTMMNASAIDNPTWGWLRIWVQLRPGNAPEAVRARLRAAVVAWRQQRVKSWPADTPPPAIADYLEADIALEPASAGFSQIQRQYRRPLFALAAVVSLVLLIACANVANLMTAQGSARAREMALRVSIGAGRQRLAQLVLVESVIIAVLACGLGIAFAWGAAPFVVSRISRPDVPIRLVLPADWRVAGFAAGLTLAVVGLFGLLPALRAAAVPSMTVLRGGENPAGRRRTFNGLIAAQVALCLVVQLVAALFVATFYRLAHQPTGFVADRLLAVEAVTRNNVRQPLAHWEEVRRRLEAVGGVESAAFCGWAPLSGNTWTDNIRTNGRAVDDQEVYFLAVSPGWLATMGIPLLAGRDLSPRDGHPGAAIVNGTFARRYFGGANPVGTTFDSRVTGPLVPSTIVGYAADARYRDVREQILPTVYVPFRDPETGLDWATFMVRLASVERPDIERVLRREVTRARPEFRVVSVRSEAELVDRQLVRERLLAVLSTFFASLALILAAVGIYGSIHHWVVQRRRDIAIRIALGAPAGSVLLHATAGILSVLAAGTAAGLAAGLASQQYLQELLYDVRASDWEMLSLPVVTTLGAAVVAVLPPVLQALRIDPARTLRAE